MFRVILYMAAALIAFGFATTSASADDQETCRQFNDGAIAACDRLIKRNPRDATAYHNRGVAYYFLKQDEDRAISDLDQAIRLDPRSAQTYWIRGEFYEGRRDYDRTISDFDQAIRLDPRNAAAYNGRGRIYKYKGDYVRAISDFDEAIRRNPELTIAYYNRGDAYNRKGDHDRAISDFDQVILLDPKVPVPLTILGLAYEGKNDLDHAAHNFDLALKLNPNDDDARRGRERVVAALASRPDGAKPASAISPAAPPAAVSERRVALVIGNSEYRAVPALANPRRDAGAVADALRQDGFQTVELAIDLDHDAMLKALRAFRDQADRADWALVYFAGHGIEINRVNYLIPVDAKLLDDRDVKAETVSYEDVVTTVGGARALRLIVLDACRVNPFKEHMRRAIATRSPTDRGLAPPPEPEPGMMVVYSAKEGEVAADDAGGGNSPFARAFVARLKMPGLEVRRLFDYVRDDVLAATRSRQQPFTYQSLPGGREFFFAAAR
jgi:tetratricopeptide (TPR) repeat protein